MPRILANIDVQLGVAIKATIEESKSLDSTASSFSIRGWSVQVFHHALRQSRLAVWPVRCRQQVNA